MTGRGKSRRASVKDAWGFTLLELLIVVALLAALAALLVPFPAQAREKGRQAACLSHLHQIGQTPLLYLQDWDGWFLHWRCAGPPLVLGHVPRPTETVGMTDGARPRKSHGDTRRAIRTA